MAENLFAEQADMDTVHSPLWAAGWKQTTWSIGHPNCQTDGKPIPIYLFLADRIRRQWVSRDTSVDIGLSVKLSNQVRLKPVDPKQSTHVKRGLLGDENKRLKTFFFPFNKKK